MINRGLGIGLVALSGALTIPALLEATDRSAAVANVPPVIGGERRSLEGLRRDAAGALAERRYAAAAAGARQVLLTHPLDRTALQVMSRAEEGLGNQDRADDLAIAASFVSWRDPFAELQMFLLTSAAGRLDDAARRADAISRVHGARGMGFKAFNTLLGQPGGAAAVATRLATRPPWRAEYFQGVRIGIGAAPRHIPTLLRALARTPVPASRAEEDQALTIMVARGLAPDALAYWRAAHDVRATALIDDPDFRSVQVGEPGQATSPFVWSLPADTLVRLSDRRDAAGRPALGIEARDDRSVLFVSRRIVVSPGRYRFTYQAGGDAAQRKRLHPDLRCSDSEPIRLQPEGGPDSTTSTFVVPQGCTLLRLGFTIEPGESARSSELSIRGVALTRL